MATLSELHQAIINYQVDRAEMIADDLRNNGVNISSEIAFAKMLLKVKGKHYQSMINVLSD